MMNYLNLIRYKNLIFIIALQLLMRYSVIFPLLQTYGIPSELSKSLFFLLVLGTVLIAAGGYAINDYFDTKIDALNRPEKVIVGNSISRKTASLLHQATTFLGVLCGLTVAFFTKSFTIGLIFILVPGLLWFYSGSYKRQFLIGNLIVAFSSALLVLLVVIAENTALVNKYQDLLFEVKIPQVLYGWITGFALFAFLTTLIREIIKDMEDIYGDRELECRTIPIVWGIKKTKFLLVFLIIITLSIMAYFVFYKIKFENDSLTMRYFIFGAVLPFLYLTYLIIKAKLPNDYSAAGGFVKFIMVIGSLYSLILYFILAQNYGITMFNIFQITNN